jgi:hypothetical protein
MIRSVADSGSPFVNNLSQRFSSTFAIGYHIAGQLLETVVARLSCSNNSSQTAHALARRSASYSSIVAALHALRCESDVRKRDVCALGRSLFCQRGGRGANIILPPTLPLLGRTLIAGGARSLRFPPSLLSDQINARSAVSGSPDSPGVGTRFTWALEGTARRRLLFDAFVDLVW